MKNVGPKAASIATISGGGTIIAAILEILHVVRNISAEFVGVDTIGGVLKRLFLITDLEFAGLLALLAMLALSFYIIARGVTSLLSAIITSHHQDKDDTSTEVTIRVTTPDGNKDFAVDVTDSSSVLKALRSGSKMRQGR